MYKKVIFSLLFTLTLLLLAYKIILVTTATTVTQENAFEYLQGRDQLVGNYTTLEVEHLDDVARVMSGASYVFLALLLLVTMMLRNKKVQTTYLRAGCKVTLLSVGLILVIAVVGFNPLFTLFHAILFPQGNWQFPIDAYILQVFPIEFFIRFALKLFLLTLAIAISLLVVLRFWKK